MEERHVRGRAHCASLVGKRFRTPRGAEGLFTHVLERPNGRPPVVVGRLLVGGEPTGQALKYTPSKAEALTTEEDA